VELSQLRAFLSVRDSGSMLTASYALGLSRTTVHARISALELSLGVERLIRTNRGDPATEFGRHFAERARSLLADADNLARSISREREEVLGELHVRGPTGIPPQLGAALILEIARRYPDLKLLLEVENDPARELPADIDVVVHFGPPTTTGAFRTFALSRFPEQLLASRRYLAAHGHPQTLEQLLEHRLLSWTHPNMDPRAWPLRDGGVLEVAPHFVSNEIYTVRSLAAAGQGIALLPDAELGRGTIPGEDFELVLPELVGRESGIWVLLPEAQHATGRSRAAVRLLQDLARGLFGVPIDDVPD
jgi:DNA-binding transcriptional LysR family regulator